MKSWITESHLTSRNLEQENLHALARAAKEKIYGNRVFIRAVIEVSNYCRENCNYCGMRRENKSLNRYRLELDQLRRLIFDNLPEVVTDLNIQTGEDPVAVREIITPLIAELSNQTRLGLSVCLGTLSHTLYKELYDAGARYYIMKIETGNSEHYRSLNAPGSLDERLQAIQHLSQQGWHVSSGMIVNLPGQSNQMILETLKTLEQLPLAGCSVSPFVPGAGTPLAQTEQSSGESALNVISMMRLQRPEWIIPAVSAMNIVKHEGYLQALRAGANLTTINMTPEDSRDDYVLYKKTRFIMNESNILRAIEDATCEPSSTSICEHLSKQPLVLAN